MSTNVRAVRAPVTGRDGTRRPSAPKAKGQVGSAAWLIPALLLLSALPLTFGVLRLLQLAGIADVMPADAPHVASPLPLVAHIVGAAFYAVLGAFQFAPGIRRRWPAWHRLAGRLLVGCGLIVALSALWLTFAYSGTGLPGVVLVAFRTVFGSAMIVSIVLGLAAIQRRDVPRHRAWMIRAYAIGLGAGTQMLVLMAAEWVAGPPGELNRAFLMGAAWMINLVLAEWRVRRR